MKTTTTLLLCLVSSLALADAKATDLVGTWKIDADAALKQADALEKSGKKDAAMGLAMIASTEMAMTFDGKGGIETMAKNPFKPEAAAKKDTSKYVVASAKGDTLNLSVTDKKGTQPIAVIIKGKSLTMTGKEGIAMPFIQVK